MAPLFSPLSVSFCTYCWPHRCALTCQPACANSPHGKGQTLKSCKTQTKSRTNAKARASAASVLAWITPMISLCILISIRKIQLCLYHLYDCPIPSIRDPRSPTHSRIRCQSTAEGFIHEENIALKVCLCQWHTTVTGRTQEGWQWHKLASLRWFLTVCAEILWGRYCISRRWRRCCGPGIACFGGRSCNYTNVMVFPKTTEKIKKINTWFIIRTGSVH